MLIQKSTISVGSVVSIKLITNDEIIAKVTSLNGSSSITVEKPLLMALTMDQRTSQPSVQMVPFWLLGANDDARIDIQTSHILAMTLSNDGAKNGYLQHTSGIILPPAGSSLIG